MVAYAYVVAQPVVSVGDKGRGEDLESERERSDLLSVSLLVGLFPTTKLAL